MPTRTLLCLLTLLAWNPGQAEIFTWKDAQGRTHFGDRPPADSRVEILRPEINTISRPGTRTLDELRVHDRKVVIYTADWCGVCRRAKRHFESERIPFQEYDVEKSAKGRRDFERLQGTGVPIILLGRQRMNGFSPERFDRLYQAPARP